MTSWTPGSNQVHVDRAIAILRHNTTLAGDVRLAAREFDALVGSPGSPLRSRSEIVSAIGDLGLANTPELSDNDNFVAMLWRNAPVESLARLASRSAFAQELLICDADTTKLAAVCNRFPRSHAVVEELVGRGLVVLANGYIIESEGVLDERGRDSRVRKTVELLLQPYLSTAPSPDSLKLRRAKKTTLALSHDLHIYKAKFFPRMIRGLLNIFGTSGQQVLDPFCGSGTALLEAALLGYDSFGIDIDPICQLISRTKLLPFLSPDSLARALDQFETALTSPAPTRFLPFIFPEELAKKLARRDKIDRTNYLPEVTAEASLVASALASVTEKGPARDLIAVLASDGVTKKIRYRFIGVGNGKYTIEIVKQPLLERVLSKIERCRQLIGVFAELRDLLGIRYGSINVHAADAREPATWPTVRRNSLVVTSPPYLPASSGREHYAASRSLAFAVLGYEPGQQGYFDTTRDKSEDFPEFLQFPETDRLLTYLASDASETADPQRDAMRFQRKAAPTRQYLGDIQKFFAGVSSCIADGGAMLLVVAHHHTFYSHRRSELEHIVSCRELYSELAGPTGLRSIEEIKMELLKSSISRARPRAKEDYFESILVFRSSAQEAAEAEQSPVPASMHALQAPFA